MSKGGMAVLLHITYKQYLKVCVIFDVPAGSLLASLCGASIWSVRYFCVRSVLRLSPPIIIFVPFNRAIISSSVSMEAGGPPAEGDVDRSTSIRIDTTIMITFTISVVALRVVVRKWITKIIGWDDWTILFAIVKPDSQP